MIIKKEFVHNGLSLSYLEKDNGADSSIIFLHGLNNRKEYYLKVMDLIDTHNCFSLDFRGHGDSSAEGEFSLRSFSLDVLGFMKHLKLTSNVYIVSSSFSAWVLSSLEEQIEVQGIFFSMQAIISLPLNIWVIMKSLLFRFLIHLMKLINLYLVI
ncbi:alpha/beta fold hydrolase [Carnobacterium sp.]|uniref:alpha/beta fold hydrolase n=1 Tax=Carnobacterium sp. TaxID=48221 RepID=UPI002FC94BA3